MPHHWEQPYYDRFDAYMAGERTPRSMRLLVAGEHDDVATLSRVEELYHRLGLQVLSYSSLMAEAASNLGIMVLSSRPYPTKS